MLHMQEQQHNRIIQHALLFFVIKHETRSVSDTYNTACCLDAVLKVMSKDLWQMA